MAEAPSAFRSTEEARRQAYETARALLDDRIIELERANAEFDRAELMAEFEAAMQRGEKFAQETLDSEPPIRAETRFLSDTLVIASWTPSVWTERVAVSLSPAHRLSIAGGIAKVMQACAIASIPPFGELQCLL